MSSRRNKQSTVHQMSDEQKNTYKDIVKSYENSLQAILAKDIIRFKNFSGKGGEV